MSDESFARRMRRAFLRGFAAKEPQPRIVDRIDLGGRGGVDGGDGEDGRSWGSGSGGRGGKGAGSLPAAARKNADE